MTELTGGRSMKARYGPEQVQRTAYGGENLVRLALISRTIPVTTSATRAEQQHETGEEPGNDR